MKRKARIILSGLLLTVFTVKAQQEPPRPPAPPSPEARLKDVSSKLQKELTLNAIQRQKVEGAYKAFFADMEKLRGNTPPPPPPPGKKEDIEKLEKKRDELIQKALSETQFKKYLKIEPGLRPRRPGGPPPPPVQEPVKK